MIHAVSHSYWSLFCVQRWPSLHHVCIHSIPQATRLRHIDGCRHHHPPVPSFFTSAGILQELISMENSLMFKSVQNKAANSKSCPDYKHLQANHPGVPNDLLELFLWNVTASIFVIGMKIFHHGLQHILSAQPISNSLATGRQRFQKYLPQNLRCRFPPCLKKHAMRKTTLIK